MNSKQKFCGECGEAFKNNARFCGECGTAIKQPQNQTEEPQNPPTEKVQESTSTRSGQKENLKQTTCNPVNVKSGLKVTPLLFWAGAWSAGPILSSALLFIFGGSYYFGHIFSKGIWLWLTAGLVSAAFLQWFKITDRNPTGKIVGIILFSWVVVMLPILWMHLEGILLMLPMSTFIGAGLSLIITKQSFKKDSIDISKSPQLKLMGSWAICGIYSGIPYWYDSLPYRIGGPIILLVTAITAIVLTREK